MFGCPLQKGTPLHLGCFFSPSFSRSTSWAFSQVCPSRTSAACCARRRLLLPSGRKLSCDGANAGIRVCLFLELVPLVSLFQGEAKGKPAIFGAPKKRQQLGCSSSNQREEARPNAQSFLHSIGYLSLNSTRSFFRPEAPGACNEKAKKNDPSIRHFGRVWVSKPGCLRALN